MWVDDYVNIAVVEAMALRELMNEAEEIDVLVDFLEA